MDRQNAAVVGQLLNSVPRAISVELKVREQLDLIERIEVLESAAPRRSRANVGLDARLRRFVGPHGESEQLNGLRSALQVRPEGARGEFSELKFGENSFPKLDSAP